MQKSKVKSQNYNSKFKIKKILRNAVDFHGHLGPYLVLGLLMGDLAIKSLKCKRHFGIEAVARGANKKPKSCLIDGIQISAGCTYGKGNIRKIRGNNIQVLFRNLKNNKQVEISLKNDLLQDLSALNGHRDFEQFARRLLEVSPLKLFELKF